MKIIKGNKEYRGMFWNFLYWQSEAVPEVRNIFSENIVYLFQSNNLTIFITMEDLVNIYDQDIEKEWKYYFGGQINA